MPRPKPTLVKKLNGNPGGRPLNDREPEFESSEKIPSTPDYLDVIAAKEWQRISAELHNIGLLPKISINGLGAYCAAYSRWVQAEKKIQRHGMVIKSPSGYPILSPYVSIANNAMQEMRKWLTEFGMTPSSKSKIQVPKKEPEKPKWGAL